MPRFSLHTKFVYRKSEFGNLVKMVKKINFIEHDSHGDAIRQRRYTCLTSYIRKKMKRVQPAMTINSLAIHQIDNLLKDVMEKICEASIGLMMNSNRSTLSTYCLAKACNLALPEGLAKYGKQMARGAIIKYRRSYEHHDHPYGR